jgi:hypothetical protein
MPDLTSLFTLSVYVEAILGLLLLFTWVQNTGIKATAWWGNAHLLRAASIAMFGMYGQLPNAVTIDIANAILLTSFAVTWAGACMDNRSRAGPLPSFPPLLHPPFPPPTPSFHPSLLSFDSFRWAEV